MTTPSTTLPVVGTLTALGFTEDAGAKEKAQSDADARGMSAGGTYTVLAVLSKDRVTALVEQNQAPEDMGGGMTAVITHPPVLILAGPRSRVAISTLDDAELIGSVAADLA